MTNTKLWSPDFAPDIAEDERDTTPPEFLTIDQRELRVMRYGKNAYVYGSKFSNMLAYAKIDDQGRIMFHGPLSDEAKEMAEELSFTPNGARRLSALKNFCMTVAEKRGQIFDWFVYATGASTLVYLAFKSSYLSFMGIFG